MCFKVKEEMYEVKFKFLFFLCIEFEVTFRVFRWIFGFKFIVK